MAACSALRQLSQSLCSKSTDFPLVKVTAIRRWSLRFHNVFEQTFPVFISRAAPVQEHFVRLFLQPVTCRSAVWDWYLPVDFAVWRLQWFLTVVFAIWLLQWLLPIGFCRLASSLSVFCQWFLPSSFITECFDVFPHMHPSPPPPLFVFAVWTQKSDLLLTVL